MRRRVRLPTAERLRRSGKLVRFVLAPDAPAMTATAAADGLFVVAKGRKRPAPVEPLKLPESVLPVRFFETPARSDVTLAMDRMLDHVARDTKRPKLAEPEDDKGPTVADLAAYLVSRGGNAAQADGWSVGKNPRGDTIYTDSSSGRVFRSKPEVVRFLNVGQA